MILASRVKHPYQLRTQIDGQIIEITSFSARSTPVTYSRTNRGLEELFLNASGYGEFFETPVHFISTFKSAPILDLGCGDGRLVRELRLKGLQIEGLDLYLTRDQSKHPSLFKFGDAYQLPYGQNQFSLILSSYSVFHFEPLKSLHHLLEESLAILKPRGQILLTEIHEEARLYTLLQATKALGAHAFCSPNRSIQIVR